jgi:hypothetical protein
MDHLHTLPPALSARAALERRYDGPVPPGASLPADYDASWHQQLLNRRLWSWQEVRRIGHNVIEARQAFKQTGKIIHHRKWLYYRRELAFALRCWSVYRDKVREIP